MNQKVFLVPSAPHTVRKQKGRTMKKLCVMAVLCTLTACSSEPEVPNVELVLEKQKLDKMSRMEVIAAIDDCRSAELRPILIYSKVKINGQLTPVPVDVTCGTYFEKRSHAN